MGALLLCFGGLVVSVTGIGLLDYFFGDGKTKRQDFE